MIKDHAAAPPLTLQSSVLNWTATSTSFVGNSLRARITKVPLS